MIELNSNCDNNTIKISEEVISSIASSSALEVDGVASMAGNFTDITELIYKKNFSKGVKIDINNNEIYININLFIKMNHKIHNVSKEVQSKVKSSVETMTGLRVNTVNVTVSNVVLVKNNNKNINEVEN